MNRRWRVIGPPAAPGGRHQARGIRAADSGRVSSTMRPSAIRMRRGQRAATAGSWVTMTMCARRAWSVVEGRQDLGGRLLSRLPVGSSASSRSGSFTSARAMATRCCWPPESSAGVWRDAIGEADRSSARAAEAADGRRGPSRRAAAPRSRARWSAAAGGRPGRRSRSARCAGAPARRRSAPRRPRRRGDSARASGRSSRPSTFISVDLPDPEAPTIATSSPRRCAATDAAQRVDAPARRPSGIAS